MMRLDSNLMQLRFGYNKIKPMKITTPTDFLRKKTTTGYDMHGCQNGRKTIVIGPGELESHEYDVETIEIGLNLQ